MKRIARPAVVALLTVFFALPAMAENTKAQFAGSVKTLSGTSFLIRNEQRIDLELGSHIFQGDILTTKENSTMGVIFRDDTILSMGSNSKVAVDNFTFNPAQDQLEFLLKVGTGTAQFITGQVAKINPDKMKVETPLATIGIRGTRFIVQVD